jgi:hypothetical protein
MSESVRLCPPLTVSALAADGPGAGGHCGSVGSESVPLYSTLAATDTSQAAKLLHWQPT